MSAFAENEAGVKPSGKKMTEGELKSMLDAQKMSALASIWSSKLSSERDDALMYYMGDMSKDMPSMDGRSAAVSTDVADTIEGLMPSLMEIFAGAEEVVKFNPVGPEDVAAAEQETDYVNHVFMQQNPGFLVLYSFIKDALLSKVGIVKVWWEEKEEIEEETYHDLTDDEFAIISDDKDVDIVEHTENPIDKQTAIALLSAPPHKAVADQQKAQGGQGAQAQSQQPGQGPQQIPQPAGAGGQAPPGAPPHPTQVGPGAAQPPAPLPPDPSEQPSISRALHDVKVRRSKKMAQVKCLGVPPEEFGIEKTARSLRLHDCNYCFHRSVVSQNRLLEQGFDEEDINALPTYTAITMPEEINRDTVDEHQNVGSEHNPSARRCEVVEHYVRMDYEGNGRAELYKVDTGSSEGQILHKGGEPSIEKVDDFPFAAMTPYIMTHRFFGRSVADIVMDIQRIKTALVRGLLDNTYLANNPRVEVSESHASDNTLDDLLISRPGGVVRTKQPGGLNWQQVPPVGQHTFPLLEYYDTVREMRTGVTKQGQGISPETLQNQSAQASNQIFSAAQARMKLIARIFAETGIRDLFILIHGRIRKHGQEVQTVRLKNQWVKIDPRDWKKRNDMTVDVGLGTGGKAERMSMMNMIASYQEKALMAGLTNLVSPSNLYETAKAITRIADHKDVDKFFTDPATAPPPKGPPPDPKLQIEMLKMQGQKEMADKKLQQESAHEQAKFQADSALDQQKFQHEKEMAYVEQARLSQEHQLKLQHMGAEHQLKQAEMGQQMLLAQHQAQQQREQSQRQMDLQAASQAHEAKLSTQKFENDHALAKQKHESGLAQTKAQKIIKPNG